MKNTYLVTSAVLALTLAGAGCAKKTDNDVIAEAQECLNKTDSTNALGCMAIVEGKTSQASNLIRCAAYFKEQRYAEPARLMQIAESMKQGGGTSVVSMLSQLSFNSPAKMDAAAPFCFDSGSKGLVMLASMARIATAILTVGTSVPANPTPDQIRAIMCDVSNPANAASDVLVGETALAAYNQGCIGTNGASSNAYCDMVKGAVEQGNGDANSIGESLKDRACQ